jgi:hypothetical protein
MMPDTLLERAVQALPGRADEVTRKLLTPLGLVQAGGYLDAFGELRQRFDEAATVYREQRFEEALRLFLDVEREAEARRRGAGRTAQLNAAACALAADRYDQTVRLLEPRYRAGGLFGLPLWNYAVALYRLGRHAEALAALEAWIPKATSEWFRLKGTLAAAGLAALAQRPDLGRPHLRAALEADRDVVTRQLRLEAGSAGGPAPGASPPLRVPAAVGAPPSPEKLLRLVRPKRPERRAELVAHLSAEDLALFDAAGEALAEGDTQRPLEQIEALRQRHADLPALDLAAAACLLFAGRNGEARDLLVRAGVGPRRSGTTLWNLACAQIRTGDWSGAAATLRECATTEYRTSVALRAALEELAPGSEGRAPATGPAPAESVAPARPPEAAPAPGAASEKAVPRGLSEGLPSDPEAARRELLARLLRPKKLPRGFRPDLTRLAELDRREVERALDATRQPGVTPSQAVEILAPLLRTHPTLYTVRAQAAAFAALQEGGGGAGRAITWLREAEQQRGLDKVSRMNLAFCHFAVGDLAGILRALEAGEQSALRDAPRFWLALAVARAATGGDPAGAAAQALRRTDDARTREDLAKALAAAGIAAPAVVPEDGRQRSSAQVALECLDRGDLAGAADRLAEIWGRDAQLIPEIGQVEPQFLRRPASSWNPRVVERFEQGLRCYEDRSYAEAANQFTAAFRASRRLNLAINAIAACVKAGEPKRASQLLRSWEARWWSQRLSGGWQLAYNLAVAALAMNEPERAVAIVNRHSRSRAWREREPESPLAGLLVVAAAGGTTADSRRAMAEALETVRATRNPPSTRLLAALAWARLTGAPGDVGIARAAIAELVARDSEEAQRQPPAEVETTKQVRDGFEHRKQTTGLGDAIDFARGVIDKQRKRRLASAEDGDRETVVRSVGVELAARLCLVEGHQGGGELEKALQALQDAEGLIAEHHEDIPAGFQARNWLELARAAQGLGLLWAAVRFCGRGRVVDPERRELRELEEALRGAIDPDREARHHERGLGLHGAVSSGSERGEVARALGSARAAWAAELPEAGPLCEALEALSRALAKSDVSPDEIDELLERAGSYASLTLPDDAAQQVRELLAAVARQWGTEGGQIPVDARIHDDLIWPRSDEQEGCCTLSLTSTVEYEIKALTVEDPSSGRELWKGDLAPGRTAWIRWRVLREDGFAPRESLDLGLTLRWRAGGQEAAASPILPVVVADREPRPRSYQTGALSPEDVVKLFGRDEILGRIRRSLGPKRASRTFFLEAPRRMGKTSILRFVERGVPDHVLAVYVNLERGWADGPSPGPPNLWAFLTERLLEAAGQPAGGTIASVDGPSRFVQEAKAVCARLDKAYVLLLLDEFRILTERLANPRNALSELKEFHDNPEHRISLLIADRLTRRELEARCPAELWAQLTAERVGPIDQAAMTELLSTPAIGEEPSDVVFLPETAQRLHELTGGYPFHVVVAAQAVIDRLLDPWAGPWVVALPEDVDAVAEAMVKDDKLFTEGLCRPDRLTPDLEDALAAVLEWGDLLALIHHLRQEDPAEWDPVFAGWQPSVEQFVTGLRLSGDPLDGLVAIGVLRRDERGLAVFSPLLERWLRRMRAEGRPLGLTPRERPGPETTLSYEELQSLDAQLIRRCAEARKPSPLKPLPYSDVREWRPLADPVDSAKTFKNFLDVAYDLFVHGRENVDAMRGYPRLCLAYHSLRLVRNYHDHQKTRTQAAISAWDQLYRLALRRERQGKEPTEGKEWLALRDELLRAFHGGLQDALELAGRR